MRSLIAIILLIGSLIPLSADALQGSRAGIVIIEAVIDRDGNVTEARVLKPLALGLSDAALDAVRKWKFKPGTMNGQPVAVYYNLTVTFRVE